MSVVKKLTRAETEALYSEANSAIWYSHMLAATQAKAFVREEDCVATLVSDALPRFATRWAALLSPKGIELRVSGVFCHGHPQVAFGKPRQRVELADLLVVHRHVSRRRSSSRAIQLQAKISEDGTQRLASNDPQLQLFTHWPPFEFVTGGLAPGLRDLREYGKGSRYALVLAEAAYPEEIQWADKCPWATCEAHRFLDGQRSLAKVLGDMLLGRDGRPVQLRRPRDDWSRTIKELLEVTGTKTYRRVNIGRTATPRLSTTGGGLAGTLYFAESPLFADESKVTSTSDALFALVADGAKWPPAGKHDARDVREGDGISTLLIETRDATPLG